MTRPLAALASLTAVYLLTLASVHPLDALGGLLVAGAVLFATRRVTVVRSAPAGTALAVRALGFLPFALAVGREIAAGTWQVALVVLGLRKLDCPGIVAVPVGERSPSGIVATALAVTLSPGDVFVDLDSERGVMLFHVLDASDPDAVRRRYEDFYRRYQRSVFP